MLNGLDIRIGLDTLLFCLALHLENNLYILLTMMKELLKELGWYCVIFKHSKWLQELGYKHLDYFPFLNV